ASNRGIDEIRDLREKIKLSPVSCRFKVYIIDEAHMLTTEAFNALLKTLEEPPAHVIFILCTTAVGKLPATIISRLARFNFKRAAASEVVRALRAVAKSEGLRVEESAFLKIAKIADGSFRDGVSVLDQLAARGEIRARDIDESGGVFGASQITDFLEVLLVGDLKTAVLSVEKLEEGSADIPLFIRELVLAANRLLLIKVGVSFEALADVDSGQEERIGDLAARFSFTGLVNIMKLLLVAESEMKIYPLPKIPLILAVCKICPEPKEEVRESLVSHEEKSKVQKISEKSGARAKKTKGKIKLAEVEAKWAEFLARVRKVNAHLVAILKSARPVDVSGSVLTIEVLWRFHKDKLEEPKITSMLEGFLEEIFKTRAGVKFVLFEKRKVLPKAVRASDVVEVSREDLTKVASEIFSK
ncbi:hypothetical protein HYZ70_02925, partial [Candidatus Curtissbacteria bacterium]|nr:hypothetical protein [Candidatus Curtissbacteria bacterium]